MSLERILLSVVPLVIHFSLGFMPQFKSSRKWQAMCREVVLLLRSRGHTPFTVATRLAGLRSSW